MNRKMNDFSWEPMKEVVIIFFGIFTAVMPIMAMLNAGETGPFHSMMHTLANAGRFQSTMYFWITGLLSSVLDNTPTYLLLFHTAGGKYSLMGNNWIILTAISAGSVFMGALTYIGNSPNLLIKSIAEQKGIKMPQFFGYMKWAFLCLTPCFILLTYLMFWCGAK
jgi:Na+/H+ antiporter NhaD/arsenite permease-like protein